MASGSQNNTSYQAQKWTNLRAFTIGNTNKDVDGTSNMSWSKDEILGASTNAYFLRGDKAWSDTLNNTFTANGDIIANDGCLKSTLNNNTVQIGSQNANFCHITNTASIPFWFNQGILMERGKTIGAAGTVYCPFQIYLGRNPTTESNALNATNPLIEFSNSDRSQYCQLIYTDYDTVQAPDSLTLVGNQNGTTFICKNGPIWVQGGSNAGGNINRLTTSSGMPGNMQYNTSRRGTQIYSNGIAFADPYNGNTNNDAGWIRHQETTANTGELEIAVGDDGDETIVVRQYNTSNGIKRTLTLLNSSGYTLFPSYINVPTNNNENPTVSQFIVTNGSDHYYRKASTAHAMAAIRGSASGTWGISISGNAATASKITDITSTDAASSSANWRRIWISWGNNVTGRPAYTDKFAFQTSTGSMKTGRIHIWPEDGSNSYNEGIRIHSSSGKWATIMLCGDDNTGDTGTSTKSWGIFNNDGTLYINKATSSGAGNPRVYANANGWYFTKAYGAVWNDFAEYRKVELHEPGYAIAPSGRRTCNRLESGARITSDTYGYAIGYMEDREDLMPVAISGRVLAYPLYDKSYYEVGDAVCAAEGGKVDKMTREEIMMYPDRILGIVNEIPDYDIWEPSREGGGHEPIHTNGRIWIDIR